MKPLQWVLLCAIFIFYLLFGGSIFMVLEQHHEMQQKEEFKVLRHDIQEILLRLDLDFYHNDTSPEVLAGLQSAKEGVINRISSTCGGNDLLDGSSSPLRWNFYNSVFFAFTVVTTIGYGHLSPNTHWSKIFTMVYALVGIPINGILICGLGDYFSEKLVKLHKRSKEKKYKGKLTLIVEIIFYLIPGLIVFLIIPAGIFVLTESWTFLDSFYFSFITLTTIGFGDFVAGMGDGHNVSLWIYKIAIIAWIIFGLGYLVMILGFITKGLKKSKKVRVVIEKRLHNIRTTKEKLTKDVEYMRRVVNELYLMKVKPIYEEVEISDNSEGNLAQNLRTYYHDSQSIAMQRKHSTLPIPDKNEMRRYSVLARTRTLSESDLDVMDPDYILKCSKEHMMESAHFLASVVTALSLNTMGNVMNAVDELNKYEEEVVGNTKGLYATQQKHPELNWRLSMLEEDDEKTFKSETGSDSALEQVVVHNAVEQTNEKTGIIGKVTEVLRKISTGTYNTNNTDEQTRKISRNEEKRRKISNKMPRESEGPPTRKISSNESQPERKISSHSNTQYKCINNLDKDEVELRHGDVSDDDEHIRPCDQLHDLVSPCAGTNGHQDKTSSSQDIKKASNDREMTPSNNKKPEISQTSFARKSSEPFASLNNDRRFSQNFDASLLERRNSKRKLSVVEQNSFEHFLKALDAVHDKLNKIDANDEEALSSGSEECSSSASSKDSSSDYPPRKYSSTKLHNTPRRRKIGVFNPGFSFVNNAFANADSENKGKNKE